MTMIMILLLIFGMTFLLWRRSGNRENDTGLPAEMQAVIILQSLSAALAVTGIYWNTMNSVPEPFTDFIGGFLAVSGLPKSFEYHAFYLGIGILVILLLLLEIFYRYLLRYPERKEPVLRLCWYSLLPAAVMAGQSIITLDGRLLSGIALAALLPLPLALWVADGWREPEDFRMTAEKLYGGCLLAIPSLIGIVLLDRRVIRLPEPMPVVFLILLAVMLMTVRFSKFPRQLNSDIFLLLGASGAPLLFLHLLPPLYIQSDGGRYCLDFNFWFYFLVWGLTALTYGDTLFRFLRLKGKPRTLAQLVSPLLLLAVAAYFVSPPESWPTLFGDDYHNGEMILPWYLFEHFKYLPYSDYLPSRGLINYLNGFLTRLFIGDNFSAVLYMVKLTDLLLVAAVLWPFRRNCGNLVLLLGMTAIWDFNCNTASGLMLGFALLFLLVVPRNYENPVRWLIIYVVGGTAVSLISIADGAIVVLSLLPMALYQLAGAVKKNRRRALFLVFLGGLALSGLLAWTPFYRIVFGMLQLVWEQAGVYTLAHCVPWMNSDKLAVMITQGIFWQLVRFSWLFVGALAISLMLFSRRNGRAGDIRWLGYAAVTATAVILIQRAGGRIDRCPDSRIMFASFVFVSLVLPFLALPFLTAGRSRCFFLLGWSFWLGLVGHQAEGVSRLFSRAAMPVYEPVFTADGAAIGIPELGRRFAVAPDHFRHLKNVGSTLNALLKPEETYLDLSHNSTGYAFFKRRPLLPYVSYNYIVSRRQQERAVAMLKKNPPPLVLIHGRGVNFHEGLLPLRSYAIYRYLLQEYRPFEDVNGLIWMIRRGEEKRLQNQAQVKAYSLDDIDLLVRSFKDPDIDAYPLVWGNSSSALLARLDNPVNLLDRVRAGVGAVNLGNGEFLASPGGQLEIALPPQANGDFLYIEFDSYIWGRVMKLSWNDDFGGRGQPYISFWGGSKSYLIPLYEAPNWVLSSHHDRLKLTLPPKFQGQFRILRLEMYKRRTDSL
ncbi:MAG: hypothetical protein PHV59_04030 [Victivallales bacterium]|nr:hypothetical protein [Victivallales bacterium]